MSVLDLFSGMTKLWHIHHGRFLDFWALHTAPSPGGQKFPFLIIYSGKDRVSFLTLG